MCLQGLGLLSVSSRLYLIWPGGCGVDHLPCGPHSGKELGIFFYIALYMIAFGNGGYQPNIATFGADQFDEEDPAEAHSKVSFFSYFYLALNGGYQPNIATSVPSSPTPSSATSRARAGGRSGSGRPRPPRSPLCCCSCAGRCGTGTWSPAGTRSAGSPRWQSPHVGTGRPALMSRREWCASTRRRRIPVVENLCTHMDLGPCRLALFLDRCCIVLL
jgi:hypothetical protein